MWLSGGLAIVRHGLAGDPELLGDLTQRFLLLFRSTPYPSAAATRSLPLSARPPAAPLALVKKTIPAAPHTLGQTETDDGI